MAENVVEFTDANFQSEVIDSDLPVLVDFWAPWCGPCKMIAPTIDELANDYAGRVKIGKLNTDENQQIPTNYQIQGIPTILLFKGGQLVEKFVGVANKEKFSTALDSQLN